MSFSDDAMRVFAHAGLTGSPSARQPRHDKAEMRRRAAAVYEATYARRAAELGASYQPGQLFNCALDMFRDDD